MYQMLPMNYLQMMQGAAPTPGMPMPSNPMTYLQQAQPWQGGAMGGGALPIAAPQQRSDMAQAMGGGGLQQMLGLLNPQRPGQPSNLGAPGVGGGSPTLDAGNGSPFSRMLYNLFAGANGNPQVGALGSGFMSGGLGLR